MVAVAGKPGQARVPASAPRVLRSLQVAQRRVRDLGDGLPVFGCGPARDSRTPALTPQAWIVTSRGAGRSLVAFTGRVCPAAERERVLPGSVSRAAHRGSQMDPACGHTTRARAAPTGPAG